MKIRSRYTKNSEQLLKENVGSGHSTVLHLPETLKGRGPGDPNHQSKSQEDLILFNCRQWVKLGGVRRLKLTGDVGYYGHADKSGSKS